MSVHACCNAQTSCDFVPTAKPSNLFSAQKAAFFDAAAWSHTLCLSIILSSEASVLSNVDISELVLAQEIHSSLYACPYNEACYHCTLS